MKKIIFVLFILVILFANSSKLFNDELVNNESNERYHVSLFAVGDNLIHSTIYEAAKIDGKYDFNPMLVEIKPLLENYDLKFINQETILGGKEIGLSTYPCFNSPLELGDALVDTGFNLISIANNHTLDRGEKAVINTINYWDMKPVIYSGAVKNKNISQVKLFNLKGIKFAYVAYTYGTNGIPHPQGKEYLVNVYKAEKSRNDILKVRDIVDVVIVSMHWGEEYQDYPSSNQKEQAEFLNSLGVDIIIGHHPHVIQPIDIIENKYQTTLVIYSLGNFLSDQKGINRLIGMGVGVDIYKDIKDSKIQLENISASLLYRYKDYNNNSFSIKLFQDLNDNYLKNYLSYFEEKKKLIQTFNNNIRVK